MTVRTPRTLAALTLLLTPAVLAGCGTDESKQSTERTDEARSSTASVKHRGHPKRSFKLTPIGKFDQPLYVTQPPGDSHRLFVVEKTGRIKVVKDGKTLKRPFLSLRGKVSQKTEQGLLSLAFDPDYETTRRFYICWTDRKGDLRVAEYKTAKDTPNRANRFSRRFVLTVPQKFPTHHGGHLLFGPDHLLYIGLGDGGGVGDPHRNGQDRSTLFGKMLRIDPHQNGKRSYTVPTSNPYVKQPGARDEIYAFGLRNPWRFSFDRKTGDLFIGDVGQEEFEEVNMRRRGDAKGANFGWSAYEGPKRYHPKLKPPTTPIPPIRSYHHKPPCSVTGGFVVRDPQLPRLEGRYLYGDFCDGKLRSLRPHAPHARDVRSEHTKVDLLSSFGEDNASHIYAVSLNGTVFRLDPPQR